MYQIKTNYSHTMFVMSQSTAGVIGSVRHMQAFYAIKLPCLGTQ